MPSSVRLDVPDGDVVFHSAFVPPADADRLLADLLATSAWRQDAIRLYGGAVPLPRLTAWHGNPGAAYTYSGIPNDPVPWTPALLDVKRLVEPVCGVVFNGVLLNRYRTGRDSVSWHSDDEPEFGDDPVIASVSLGGARTFQLRHKTRPGLRAAVGLTHGSLLVMRGGTQPHWVHRVPKTAKPVAERINLTFRVVRSAGS